MIVGFFRATTFALKNMRRNIWLALANEFLLILTLCSITLVMTILIVGNALLSSVEEKVDIDFYFYTNVAEENISSATEYLQSLDAVNQVIYITPQEALEQFIADHQDEPELLRSLEELGDTILPARLVVRADTIDAYPKIRETFMESEYGKFVMETDDIDNAQIIDRMDQIISRVTQISIIISSIFIVISVIVIFNTFRMTIYAHREEVGIMKLVGATNWFIRAPFIIESVLFGVFAAGVTIGIVFFTTWISDAAVSEFFAGYDFSLFSYLLAHWPQLVFAEIIGAVAFSVISSMIAITRYLKV